MALTLLAANNAQTVLAAGISASATSLTVNSGTGSLFPAPSDGVSFFKLTLIDAATGQLTEIMHVTARTGDTMTIERGQEGTTARAWSANDIAANMMTAGTLNYILANFQPLDATLTALAGLATGANKLPYFTGPDSASQTDITSVGRDIIGKTTIADILAYLGLGAIATSSDIQSGIANKLVDAAGLIGAIATDADIQNKVARKFVDAYGLINAITTMQDVQDGALRKFVNALTLKNYLPVKPLTSNGFIRIPDVAGGTIIQYGQVITTVNEGTQNIILPTPFPTAGRFAIAIPLNQSGSTTVDIFAQLQGISTTGVNFFFSWATSSSPANGFQWFAIGY